MITTASPNPVVVAAAQQPEQKNPASRTFIGERSEMDLYIAADFERT